MDNKIQLEIDKLKAENSFLNNVIESIPASVHILELSEKGDSKPVWANSGYEKLSGYKIGERNAIKATDIYHPDDLESMRQVINNAISGKANKGGAIFRFKKKEGGWKWTYVYATIFNYKPDGKYLLCIGMDVSNEFTLNRDKSDQYLKEIAQLRNKITISKLTKTEKEVIGMLAAGQTIKDIASIRNRSKETINNHKRNIFNKLGFKKLTELVCFAVENGLT